MKRYVLFDLDGTLVDSMVGVTKAIQTALHSKGIRIEDHRDLRALVGPPARGEYTYDDTECRRNRRIVCRRLIMRKRDYLKADLTQEWMHFCGNYARRGAPQRWRRVNRVCLQNA